MKEVYNLSFQEERKKVSKPYYLIFLFIFLSLCSTLVTTELECLRLCSAFTTPRENKGLWALAGMSISLKLFLALTETDVSFRRRPLAPNLDVKWLGEVYGARGKLLNIHYASSKRNIQTFRLRQVLFSRLPPVPAFPFCLKFVALILLLPRADVEGSLS